MLGLGAITNPGHKKPMRSYEPQHPQLSNLNLRKENRPLRFVATKHHVEFFGELLQQQGLPAATVYGTMDQTARQEQAKMGFTLCNSKNKD